MVSSQVDDVIRAIVELGGTYPDVVQALEQAKTSQALGSRFEVDALPDGDRAYRQRDEMPRAWPTKSRAGRSKWPARCPSYSRPAQRRRLAGAEPPGSSRSPGSTAPSSYSRENRRIGPAWSGVP